MFPLLIILSCKAPKVAHIEQPMLRYRVEEPTVDDGKELLQRIPHAQWDQGLFMAAQDLMSALTSSTANITTESVQLATSRNGFPGQARFAKILNGGAFPEALIRDVLLDTSGKKVDVALAKRSYADGSTLWLLGWAKHLVEIDPLPIEIPLDGAVPIRVELSPTDRGILYVASPDQPIEVMEILPEAHRWLNDFHSPGAYRFELVTDGPDGPQVALLFSLYVDQEAPMLQRLYPLEHSAINPIEAEDWLYEQVNQLRTERGLSSLQRFSLFEKVAREHSAWMASTGVVNHSIAGVTAGVPDHAARLAHPRARHYENVAAAPTVEEALALTMDSPGHFKVLLCESCTHLSIGAAIEPTLMGQPRIFVTWEVMEFPQGEPVLIEKLNRH